MVTCWIYDIILDEISKFLKINVFLGKGTVKGISSSNFVCDWSDESVLTSSPF